MSLLSKHGKAGIFYPKTYQLLIQNIAASYGKLCRKSIGIYLLTAGTLSVITIHLFFDKEPAINVNFNL